ncbi:MAG TPA: hypothetical protein DCS93_25910 [Microscillaceae bacterium]|nr:hypothetical protein [Microscillaceae bacterium]
MTAALSYQKPIHLLHIEDNHSDALILKELISEKFVDLEISNAYDGDEAIKFLQQNLNNAPNAIILDLNLPRKKGTEVLDWIKKETLLRHIPIIVLTTSMLEEDVTFCYRHYANVYLRKPKNLDEYIQVVSQITDFWFSLAVLPDKDLMN